MLNQEMDQVVLVKGWKKSASWSFPRGKINKDEPDLECAIREVHEETGYNLKDAGLVRNKDDMKYIEVTMREQHMRLYIFRGVPMDLHFEPRTRKEISKIQWYKLSELPTQKKQKQQQEGQGDDLAVNANKFYMVAPFVVPLKKWIAHRKKIEKHNGQSHLSVTSMKMNGTMEIPETSVSDTSNHNSPPTADALEGLKAKLRQSNQAKTASDLSEALRPPMSAQDASAHLKSLLHVSPTIVENGILSAPEPETLKSDALLALLQPAGSIQHNNHLQKPLDNLSGVETVDERFVSQPSVSLTQNPTSNISVKPRSGHQGKLLDLFRKTPVSEPAKPSKIPIQPPKGLSTPKLELPLTLIELSAMPSPAHSREPSHVKTKAPFPGSSSTLNDPSTVLAKPATNLKPENPPVSATVNGPLNVPQFEVLASNPKSGKGRPPNKHPVPPRQAPVTIITGPVSARNPQSLVRQKAPVISAMPPERPSLIPTDPRSQISNSVVTDNISKVNQPQTLRRPGSVLRTSEDLAIPSPIQPLPSPTVNTRLIRGKTASKDHRNLLLSLFSKPSSVTTPTTLNPTGAISPLPEQNGVIVPTAATRSTMGSKTSPTGDGSMKLGIVSQTPRTAPATRTVLLGYLDEVAKGARC